MYSVCTERERQRQRQRETEREIVRNRTIPVVTTFIGEVLELEVVASETHLCISSSHILIVFRV